MELIVRSGEPITANQQDLVVSPSYASRATVNKSKVERPRDLLSLTSPSIHFRLVSISLFSSPVTRCLVMELASISIT